MINKDNLQNILERDACKKNGGICESYNYCKFCAEPKTIFRKSDTPCADAYIDMKKITDLLNNRKKIEEYIESTSARIKIWKEELNEYWDDEHYLNSWYSDLKRTDTFGMPKSTGNCDLEIIFLKREKIRKKIIDFIKLEEERLKTKYLEYSSLENAIDKLNEKDKFIIECRYGEMRLSVNDTITSFYKKYDIFLSIDQIKKKISGIKKQIYKKYIKNKKCRTF